MLLEIWTTDRKNEGHDVDGATTTLESTKDIKNDVQWSRNECCWVSQLGLGLISGSETRATNRKSKEVSVQEKVIKRLKNTTKKPLDVSNQEFSLFSSRKKVLVS